VGLDGVVVLCFIVKDPSPFSGNVAPFLKNLPSIRGYFDIPQQALKISVFDEVGNGLFRDVSTYLGCLKFQTAFSFFESNLGKTMALLARFDGPSEVKEKR
jgi:hypothetical protein